MALQITDEVIKEFTERNNLPDVYKAFQEVKNEKDYKSFMKDPTNKKTIEAIEAEMKMDKRREVLASLREDPTIASFTDEELYEIAPDQFADIAEEKAEVSFGFPENLFIPKGGMSNREWLATEREIFKRAGLDFDNLEDRRQAARRQAEAESKKATAEEAKKEGATGWATPRSQERMEKGEAVTKGDVASDVLRIAEAAPPAVAIPAIVGRNVLDAYLEDKDVGEAINDAVVDVGLYAAGNVLGKGAFGGATRKAKDVYKGLKKFLGGSKGGVREVGRTFDSQELGSRRQIVKATKEALEGGEAGFTNPYKEQAARIVEEAGLTEEEGKKATNILSKYLEKTKNPLRQETTEEIQKASLGTTTKKVGKKFDEEVKAEAKRIGRERVASTAEAKLDFEDVSRGLSEEDANALLKHLQSQGVRDSEGGKSFVGVAGEIGSKDSKRNLRESELIAKWLKNNTKALNTFSTPLAEKEVAKRYGTKPVAYRGLLQEVLKTPVAYESPFTEEGSKFAVKTVPQVLGRYLAPELYGRKRNSSEEE
jgi:hypothetical protein